MSLEEALNKNTAAVQTHNELLARMLASAANSADKPAATKAADKPAANKAADKPVVKPAAKATTTKSKGAPTLELVTERITAFLKTGDADTRAEHKEQAGRIIEHFGVDRFTQIPSEHWTTALEGLAAFEAGEEPEFLSAGDGDDGSGDEDESMV